MFTFCILPELAEYLLFFFCPGVSAYVSERQGGAPHTDVSERQGGAPHTDVGRSRGPLEVERARRGLLPAAAPN
jgi:hypothetical protein